MQNSEILEIMEREIQSRAQALAAQIIAAEKAKKPMVQSEIAATGEVITPYMFDGVKYLTAKQACKLLDVKYPTVWRWNKVGMLPHVKVGGRVYYHYEDVKNLMNGGNSVGVRLTPIKEKPSERVEL